MAPRLIGFDLDGTLLDTSGELAASVNHALAGINLRPLERATVQRLIGGGTRAMLARAIAVAGGGTVDPTTLDGALAAMLAHYRAHLGSDSPPYPGLVDALDRLGAAGFILGVATNKAAEFARPLLDKAGLADRFAAIVGGEDGLAQKPAPDLLLALATRVGAPAGAPCLFVGDSRFDLGAARAAGWGSILVSFGYSDPPAATLGADRTIDHYDELPGAIAALGWPL